MKIYPEWVLRRWVEGSYFRNRQPGKMLRLKEFEIYGDQLSSFFPFGKHTTHIGAKDPELLKFLYRGYCKPEILPEEDLECCGCKYLICNECKLMEEIEEKGKLIVPGTNLKKLISEDDCAPDAFVTFNREFQKITGLAVSEFEKTAETAHSDTFFRWTKGVYVLEYHADDPFHLLSEILPEAKNDKNT